MLSENRECWEMIVLKNMKDLKKKKIYIYIYIYINTEK